MSDIDLRRVHDLDPVQARAMAERLLERLGREFGLQGQWAGNVLRFHRPGVQGHLALGPGDLHLQVTLGFLLKAMRGRIEHAVARELDQLFPPPGRG